MPAITPFSVDQYCRHPAYAAALEVWLTTTPIPATDQRNLATYTEAAFPGYQRFTGPRDTIFQPPIVGAVGSFLESRLLNYVATAGGAVTITAALIVATFPGEAAQIVAVVPVDKTIAGPGAGFGITVSITNLTQTP